MANYHLRKFPKSRIATFDVFGVGREKHHIYAMLECDVTDARLRLKELKASGGKVSFTGWLLKTIADTVAAHKEAAAFLYGRRQLIVFDDVNISIIVEKEVEGKKVPIPLVIEKAQEKTAGEITAGIAKAKEAPLTGRDIVLHRRSSALESLYYRFPGWLRRMVWRYMLRNPKLAYAKMGNVSFTSIGMMGQINGWFIHSAVHPLSFGIGSIVKKPVVKDDAIVVREILHITILVDHDVIDGAPMARMAGELVGRIEGAFLGW